MLFEGKPEDKLKAIAYFRQVKRATLRNRLDFKVEDGKLYHGYKNDPTATIKNAAIRRDINAGKKFGEISPLASFDRIAIRSYARSIGIPTMEMYKNPAHFANMVKDRNYSKFLLQDNAAAMV